MTLAAAKSVKPNDNSDLAFVIKSASKCEEQAASLKNAVSNKPTIQMTPEDALALKVACDLSDNQYQILRNSAKIHNADLYPPLSKIYEAKVSCYPEDLHITETSATCSLQNMANHTLSQLLSLPLYEFGNLPSSPSPIQETLYMYF